MKTVLLISNAHAGSVSRRTRDVIVRALQADFKLETADTRSRAHATELAREAVERGFDAVVAFGGDGTINEAAQALVNTDISFGFIPGGSTNVMARSLGVPRDPVEATSFVASHLRSGTTRVVNMGRLNDRYFLFCAGIGLDAEVVRRVEGDPVAKRKRGEWFFLSNALKVAFTQYRGADPQVTLETPDGKSVRLVLLVCANGRPFTYFRGLPVDVCPQAELDRGLDVFGLSHARTLTIPRIAWSVLVSRSHVSWRSGVYRHDLDRAIVRCDKPLPAQVDGDYIGELSHVDLTLSRDALRLLV